MTKQYFLELISKYLKEKNFTKRGNNFYFDFKNDIMLIIGLQKSTYEEYYYFEYGFVFKKINSFMPYPKFHQANIRCGRINVNGRTTIYYQRVSETDLLNALEKVLNRALSNGQTGIERIKQYYIQSEKRNYMAIVGQKTLEYLGLKGDGLTVHSI